jgi:aminoglycoside 6-adenylyltransferase
MTRWPYKPESTFNDDWITRLILFTDGVRIDFQITDNLKSGPFHYNYGVKILIDKDNVLTQIPEATYSKYNVKKPSEEEYNQEEKMNAYWLKIKNTDKENKQC